MRWIIFQKLVLYVLQYGVRKENEVNTENSVLTVMVGTEFFFAYS